jgi:DNA-binding transcriptional ArsR family regulator
MDPGRDRDLHLQGRGLLLVPSVFGVETVALDPDAEPQPTLFYPAGLDRQSGALPLFAVPPAGAPSPLAELLGRTRAAVLQAVAEHPGCSTKELATLIGIAPASASEHATTLRKAGMIDTVRHRNTALHSLTAFGAAFLDAPRADPLG